MGVLQNAMPEVPVGGIRVAPGIKKFCDLPHGSGNVIRIAVYDACVMVCCENAIYRVDPDGAVSEIK